MSLSLVDTLVTAAFDSRIICNVLSRRCATSLHVDVNMSSCQLPVTLVLESQTATTTFDFLIINDACEYDVIFGPRWEIWRQENNSMFCYLSGFNHFSTAFSSVRYSLPLINLTESDIKLDSLFSDVLNNTTESKLQSSRTAPCSDFASTSTLPFQQCSSSLKPSGHAILHDMLVSQRATGIGASIFHSSADQIRKVCTLHGLDVAPLTNIRSLKSRLLYHIVNGDCFMSRCEKACPALDRSACLSVAAGFLSPLAITVFVTNLLKSSTPSEISTEDLLLVVESTGTQTRYENRLRVRRQLLASLHVFLQLCERRARRTVMQTTMDPYGDLFMGFEDKRRPVLESIMNHHGLSACRENKLTTEEMRSEIISHIVLGHCARSMTRPFLHKFQPNDRSHHDSLDDETEHTCEDFVRNGNLKENQKRENEITILNFALQKISSRRTLLRIMQHKEVPHDSSHNLRRLRSTLKRYLRVLEKRSTNFSTQQNGEARPSTDPDWPNVVPQTLKDKIAENFRFEISQDHLQSFVCSSCSIADFTQHSITANKSSLNLTCLQHPEMRLSGMIPDLSNISNENLDHSSLKEGILLDRRGMKDGTLALCKDCYCYLKKGKTPPLSLANHLLLGDVPQELKDLTPVEESMIARCRAKVCVIHLKAEEEVLLSNTQRGMRGHIVVYPQKPENLLNVLPPSVEDICTPICVVFIGSQRPTQEWLRRYAKPLIVRRERVRSALLWLKTHNKLYHNIVVDETSLKTFPENDIVPVHIEVVDKADAGEILSSRYDEPQNLSQNVTPNHNNTETIFDSVVVEDLKADATINQMRAAAMKHMKIKGGGFLQIPHANKPANEFYNPDLLPLTYPTLFPYGQGGFENMQRVTPLSFKRQVKYFFSIADRRFQEHYSFLFTVFNILQRRAILLQTSLKVKRSSFDYFAQEFQDISSDTIQRICDRLSHTDESSVFKTATIEERRVLRLMKEVNVINSHVPGSSAARVAMRNEIRAMIMTKGLPSFYITINPADIYNPLVKFLAGAEIDINNLLPAQVPDYMTQSILVARNPFIAAQFFNIYLKAFMKIILGYDPSDYSNTTGVLGPVNGYYGCVEAQGRGTLHCHMLVWLKGALNCDQIRDKVLAHDNGFQTRMINFINDCISNEIPPLPLEPITVPSDNMHPCCTRGIIDLNNMVARQKDLHNIAKSCQSHNHSATCYKYWKQGQPKECRFGLGKHRYRENTEFDSNGELQIRCLDGLVNNFNKSILEMMRCNMDIQFLGSGPSTKAVIYYITDYITKAQLKTHIAYAALALAVQKLEQIDTADDLLTVRAKKLLQKCAYSMIARQELSAQQVSSYLLDLEDHFTSDTFQAMYWTNYERYVDQELPIIDPSKRTEHDTSEEHILKNNQNDGNHLENLTEIITDVNEEVDDSTEGPEPDEIVISTDNNGKLEIHTSQMQDYLLRGGELQSLSLWEYTSVIQKVSKTRARNDDDQTQEKSNIVLDHDSNSIDVDSDTYSRPKYHFHHDHPDYNTHIQQLRHPHHRPIPNPIGPSFPRRDNPDSREKYCRLMLILLKPWNTPQDLILEHENFEAEFQFFIQGNEKWKPLLDNMQLLHECRDDRDDHFERRSRARNILLSDPDFEKRMDNDDDFEMNTQESISEALLNHLKSIDDSRSLHMNESQNIVNECLQEAYIRGLFTHEDNLEVSSSDQLGDPINNETTLFEQDWRHEYEQRKQTWKSNILTEQDKSNAPLFNDTIYDTTISSLGTENLGTENPSIVLNKIQIDESKEKKRTASLINMQKTLSDFTLNQMQMAAYNIITEHSITDNAKQLRMYIAGPGGTGKSRVIDALRHFFHLQNQECRLRVASFTGVASRNIHGMTLHSALCLNKQKKRSDKRKTELIAMWRKVDYLIIDEVSMIGCKLLLQIHEALCDAKENTEPFGGINIIFVGDFAQLPPVGDVKLYSHLHKEKIGTPKGQQNVFGKLLWLSIDKVVILKELVRQNTDEDTQFTALLTRLRTGLCTQEDYDFLSTKLLRNSVTNFSEPKWMSAPIIVSNNDVKDALNLESAKSFANRTKQRLHFYYATDKRKGQPIADDDLRKKLWSYHSGKTEQRVGILPLCRGMPVMITQNYDVENGIVNGCIGTLQKVNYMIDNDGYRHATSCIIRTESISGSCLPHLNNHEIAVLEDESTLTFTHPYSHIHSSFQRNQLPITPAFAITAHKSQGNTLPSAILDLESCLTTEAVYVMLSRIQKSNDFRILRPFHIKKINTRCSEDLRREFRRLEFLHNETLNSSNIIPHPNISGGVHDLQNIEKWFKDRIVLY